MHSSIIKQKVIDATDVRDKLEDQVTESRCLASILQNGLDAYIDVEGILNENTFTDESNQVIWQSIASFFDTEGENIKVTKAAIMKYADALGYRQYFEKKDEKDYLTGLFTIPAAIQDAKILGTQLKKLQFKRELYTQLQVSIQNVVDVSTLRPLGEILAAAEDPVANYITKISHTGNDGKFLTEDAEIYVNNLFDNPNTISGLSTGFTMYDDFIGGGLERETMHVVVARAKVGKSTMGLNIGLNVANRGDFVIISDYEMNEQKWLNRLLAHVTGINLRKFKRSTFDEREKDLISDAAKAIKNLPIFYININGKSLEESLSCFKRILNKRVGKRPDGEYRDCLLIYDYLRLNESSDISKNMQEYQALGFQAIKLKNFAIRYRIPIFTFVQANREGIKDEGTGTVSGSDRILWLCDSLAMFKRKEEEELQEDRANNRQMFNRKLIPQETRDGPEVDAGTYINYNFDGSIAKITEGPTNIDLLKRGTGPKVTDVERQTDF